MISPQLRPYKGHIGTGALLDIFSVISSGQIISLIIPDFGCSPLPLKIDLGSILKLPTFSKHPSITA